MIHEQSLMKIDNNNADVELSPAGLGGSNMDFGRRVENHGEDHDYNEYDHASEEEAQSMSILRRRPVAGKASQGYNESSKPKFKRFVESVDLFPKVQEESMVETKSGIISTILTLLLIVVLFVAEVSIYFSSKTYERMTIDTLPSELLKTHFDVEFPALRCSQSMIEVMDVTGALHEVSLSKITKQRLMNGQPISEPMSAYEELQFKLTHPEGKDEGCRVRGHIGVTKVAGNIHVAVGAMIVTKSRRHVHNFSKKQMLAYNSSHIVHSWDFGERFARKASYSSQPTLSQSPLSGVRFITKPDSPPATVRYFIKVVPTTFRSEVTGVTFNTNQYTFTEAVNYIDPEQPVGKSIPGVFFVYDFSPYRILVTESPGYTTTGFIVTLCALIAGVVTIAGVVDSVVFYLSEKCCSRSKSPNMGFVNISSQNNGDITPETYEPQSI